MPPNMNLHACLVKHNRHYNQGNLGTAQAASCFPLSCLGRTGTRPRMTLEPAAAAFLLEPRRPPPLAELLAFAICVLSALRYSSFSGSFMTACLGMITSLPNICANSATFPAGQKHGGKAVTLPACRSRTRAKDTPAVVYPIRQLAKIAPNCLPSG